jgi:hypothetical protein
MDNAYLPFPCGAGDLISEAFLFNENPLEGMWKVFAEREVFKIRHTERILKRALRLAGSIENDIGRLNKDSVSGKRQ